MYAIHLGWTDLFVLKKRVEVIKNTLGGKLLIKMVQIN